MENSSVKLATTGVLLFGFVVLGTLVATRSLAESGAPSKQSAAAALPTFSSAEERQEFEAAGRATAVAADNTFRDDFIRAGSDIHSLPNVFIATQTIGDGSIGSALGRSAAVVVGRVVGQSVERDGYVASRVQLLESVDGAVESHEIVIVQNGGPALTSNGAALVQDDKSPILFPGVKYLLFARPVGRTTDAKYSNAYAVGGPGNIYEVRDGTLVAQGQPHDLPAQLDRLTLTEAKQQIVAALPGANRLRP
jgi:hypothetical protein